ncbi:uncharacterized protein RCC_06722 [Ramularia collo-cygni]|uniref:Secreted protein CSS2 C-terminal domain-containing protein n=1 Tax=Ramularia collo-cygni TaxID=112498 RepID=A0A2D3UTL5_9PEZI|nr:uncharacterized protein RCC_06722 [Ramularia collo-cygni]CZT20862.1 uncharacterized protein RCC_06722 [Ramularia collo-cygni]
MSTGIKDVTNERSCGIFRGAYNDVAYRYTATGTHCDTTAEQATIGGAIEHHIKEIDGGKVCGMECLNLSHGGTWSGYLLIGPRSSFDNSVYCGPTLSFNHCDSGGKNDFV